MMLAPGTRLGSYEIASALGAGGMGEVYRAKDTKLDRLVAIKVLPSSVAGDPERLARFEREAKAVAALSHPNILAIHDFGTANGIAYAVMELLEGETLRQRLTIGALPVRKAIDIATQIAIGLAAAHRKGIVHRDLKPENVFLTRDGHVKILDFGLAKQVSTSGTAEGATELATEAGTVLGTAAYMAPEQIRGQPVDGRADLFACGAVLHEMLTGLRAFERDTPAETMTAILNDEPPDLATRVDLPPAFERIVRHTLEKDPDDRFQSARDLSFALQSVGQGIGVGRIAATLPLHGRSLRGRELTAWLIAALALAGAVLGWSGRQAVAPAQISNLTLGEEADLSTGSPQGLGVLVSPDGTRLISQGPRGDRRLFLRTLDHPGSTSLPGTDLGRLMFISPDGRFVGFSTLTALKKISLVDGSVTSVCQIDTMATSASVGGGGEIVFSMGLGLWIVPGEGGTPKPLTVLAAPEQSQLVSGFLPDGRTLVFTNWVAGEPRIEALTVSTGVRQVIVEHASGGQYVSTGHLLFVRDGALLAAPFNLDRLSAGAPVRILDRVRVNILGLPKLSVSRQGGVLVYAEPEKSSLVWVTRSGLETPLDLPPREYQYVRVSRDGRRVAFEDEASLWVADLTRGGTARVSSDRFIWGVGDWSPDDSQLAYSSLHELLLAPVDRTAKPRRLAARLPVWKLASSWSPDGQTIAYSAYFGATNGDVYVEAADGSGDSRPFVATAAYEAGPQFSPDGRFLAFASSESGRLEVYVAPFPGPGPRWPISTDGGTHPRWSREGNELFYRKGDDVMAVPITTKPTFSAGKPVLLFRGRYRYGSGLGLATYDVARDGRFLMIKSEDETLEQPRILLNWAESLQQHMRRR